MRSRVVAIALEGPNVALLEQWLATGLLPNLRAFSEQSSASRHTHIKRFRNERCWDLFLSGRNTGGTGSTFEPETYKYYNNSLQHEQGYQPFYALADQRRVCVFDVPATISGAVNGLQVMGWASEMNVSAALSSPADLINEIHARYGADPKLVRSIRTIDQKNEIIENSYTVPSLYDDHALAEFCDNLLLSVQKRGDIILDLLHREPWNLFLVAFPELHTANHVFWHWSQPHPLNATGTRNALLEVMIAIDDVIGRIIRQKGHEADFAVFTIDHTAGNSMDLPSMVILPEFLYRWSNQGEPLLTSGPATAAPLQPRRDYRQHWKHEIWENMGARAHELLLSPSQLEAAGDPLSWHPAAWYRQLWPNMKAFALPSVADGYIRINMKGREQHGIVDLADYDSTLTSLENLLRALVNSRTGKPAVRQVTRTRSDPFASPDIPPDIIVGWDDESPADAMDHHEWGRVGPLPFFRSGGHVAHGSIVEGLLWVRKNDPQDLRPEGQLEDLPATLLAMIGAARPAGMVGQSLLVATQ